MRCTRSEEILGLDFTEHCVNPGNQLTFSFMHKLEQYSSRGMGSVELYELFERAHLESTRPGDPWSQDP